MKTMNRPYVICHMTTSIDGAFVKADVIDEISLVVAPMVADTEDKPLFMKSKMSEFTLAKVKQYDNAVWLNYKR